MQILQIVCPALIALGLSLPEMGWTSYPLWAGFAALLALLQLATLVLPANQMSPTISLIATGALVAYWVVIVLPGISSNGGFVQTLGVGCAVVATWLRSSRK